MNRSRKFSFSWGRKLFFGLSWPLTMIVGIVYLRSYILPVSSLDWLYFIVTFIGCFGALNAGVYFLLYSPLIYLMPSYYLSRFWSLILIITLNLFVLLDAISFSSYHLHLYSYLLELYFEKGVKYLLGSTPALFILFIAVIILSLSLWIRGEKIWRNMQTKFSTPIKNWYLAIIFICLILSQTLYHYRNIDPKLAEIFPGNLNFPRNDSLSQNDHRQFFYPRGNLECKGKANPNVIMITLGEWSHDQLTPELMPSVSHMKRHLFSYNSHYGAGLDIESGYFSLIYSIPASYQSSVEKINPAFITELENRKYEMIRLGLEKNASTPQEKDEHTMSKFREWLKNISSELDKPYFLALNFSQHASETDKYINEIILSLVKGNILENSYVLMTGAYSGSESLTVPLLIGFPDRKPGEVTTTTSHYDVMPSLMQKMWNCKKAFKAASVGYPLDQAARDWLLLTGKNTYKIIDFSNNNVTTVSDGKISDTQESARHELIFSSLTMMTKYSKSSR